MDDITVFSRFHVMAITMTHLLKWTKNQTCVNGIMQTTMKTNKTVFCALLPNGLLIQLLFIIACVGERNLSLGWSPLWNEQSFNKIEYKKYCEFYGRLFYASSSSIVLLLFVEKMNTKTLPTFAVIVHTINEFLMTFYSFFYRDYYSTKVWIYSSSFSIVN